MQKNKMDDVWGLTLFVIHRLQKMCKIANAASIESAMYTVINDACKYQNFLYVAFDCVS